MFRRSEALGVEFLVVQREQSHLTVVLLHGFGADMENLAGLVSLLDPQKQWNWVLPNGIIDVPLGYDVGKAWFPIRVSEIERAAASGKGLTLDSVLPDGMKVASQRLRELMSALHLKPENLVIGGFSQGAMMSVECALSLPSPVRGLMLFSGTLVNGGEWRKLSRERGAIPYIQSHGRQDPVLAVQGARMLNDVLKEAGWPGEYHEFDGVHEISEQVVHSSAAFLKKRA
jgi:phospholipase/carboxylesterase